MSLIIVVHGISDTDKDSEAAQRIKSFVRLLVVEKKLDQIVKDAGFEVPTELKVRSVVLLSNNIA